MTVYNRILVPLDGSRPAEAAVQLAAAFARMMPGSGLTLLHVMEKNAPETVHGYRHITRPEEALTYLESVRESGGLAGLSVECHVHLEEVGDISRGIAGHVAELSPDLVAMCAHGGGGLRGRLFGTVAQQVIGLGATPVLLVQPGDEPPPRPFRIMRVMAPLDGDPTHLCGLDAAAEIAKLSGAVLDLVMVVPTRGDLSGQWAAARRLMPGATAAMLEMAEDGGESYLAETGRGLEAKGVAVELETARGDPAKTVARIASLKRADLIVFGTHGRAGAGAFWSGSVAARVASECRTPQLLIPVDR